MAEIDQYKENIKENLESLENFINKSPLYNNDKEKWKAQIQAQKKQIDKQIKLLEEQIRELTPNQASSYVGSVRSFKKRLQMLTNTYEKRGRGQSFSQPQTKKNIIQTPQQRRQIALQQIFQKGDDAQLRTKQAIKDMNIMVQKGIQLSAQINLQLTAQIQQLDRMNDKVKDTSSTLQKAKRNITYFAKAMQCDKCMIGLLSLIMIALVAVIALAIKKNSK